VSRDCLVPFRIPNGEVDGRVSSSDELGMDTSETVSGKELDQHTGHTYFSFPVCLRPCSLGLSPSQH